MDKITVKKFKNIDNAELKLDTYNIIIGSNNSGKSSFLQAVHMASGLARITRIRLAYNHLPQDIPYAPTTHYEELYHKDTMTSRSTGDKSPNQCEIIFNDEDEVTGVSIHKGSNGAITGKSSRYVRKEHGYFGDNQLSKTVSSENFSIYVPGLSGVAPLEEYKGDSIVNKGVARGDAPIFMRNIIYRLLKGENEKIFHELLQKIFPRMELKIHGDPCKTDDYITVYSVQDEIEKPIELLGTGALQIIQILSYMCLYKPKLLLLDEPDAHLHPNKQKELVKTLLTISEYEEFQGLQIIATSHSLYFISEFYEKKNCVYHVFTNGHSVPQNSSVEYETLLRAIEHYDTFSNTDKDTLVLAEDSNFDILDKMLKDSGYKNFKIIPYKSATNLDHLKQFLVPIARGTLVGKKIIIHMDRDFLLDDELSNYITEIENIDDIKNIKVFVTKGSDIESHLIETLQLYDLDKDEWLQKFLKDKYSIDSDNNLHRLQNKYSEKRKAALGIVKLKADENLKGQPTRLENIDIYRHIVGKDFIKYVCEQKNIEIKEWIKHPNLNLECKRLVEIRENPEQT